MIRTLAAVVVAVCFGAPAIGDVVRVIGGSAAESVGGPAERAEVVRARAIGADLAGMSGVEIGWEARLSLFADVDLRVRVDRIDGRGPLRFTWTGRVVEGGSGSFVMSVEDDAVMGAVWLDDGRVFEVASDAGGSLWATELRSEAFAPCATDAEHCVHAGRDHGAGSDGAARGGCDDDGSVIDVMVVYTPAARTAAGGTNSVRALANSAVAAANSAYANSGIAARLELVYLDEVDYVEGSGFSADLSRLRGRTDGEMDTVHGIRELVRADMVALLSNNSDACGIAYLMTGLSTGFSSSAFSATRHSCAVGNLSFAHELGHNMGSSHDRDNAGTALYPYSYGHRWYGTNGSRYRSVMAYSPGSRRPYFSNPDVLYVGTPTGVPAGQPDAADNARSINEASFTVSNFRRSSQAAVVLQPVDVGADVGGTAFFQAAAVGAGDLSYRWQLDGVDLEDGPRVSGSGTAALLIEGVVPGDAGAYRLGVSNGCGTVYSSVATLTLTGSNCVADLYEPFGVLNFFDVVEFIARYTEKDPRVDLAAPFGVFTFFDMAAYLDSYNAGCP